MTWNDQERHRSGTRSRRSAEAWSKYPLSKKIYELSIFGNIHFFQNSLFDNYQKLGSICPKMDEVSFNFI